MGDASAARLRRAEQGGPGFASGSEPDPVRSSTFINEYTRFENYADGPEPGSWGEPVG